MGFTPNRKAVLLWVDVAIKKTVFVCRLAVVLDVTATQVSYSEKNNVDGLNISSHRSWSNVNSLSQDLQKKLVQASIVKIASSIMRTLCAVVLAGCALCALAGSSDLYGLTSPLLMWAGSNQESTLVNYQVNFHASMHGMEQAPASWHTLESWMMQSPSVLFRI